MHKFGFIILLSIFLNTVYYDIVNCSVGIEIFPIKKEIYIDPGTSYESSLRISNNYNQKITVLLEAEEFNITNYQYDYIFDKESSINSWISFQEDSFFLEPNQAKNINYTIGVPLSAEPGGRYLSIFISSDKKFDNDNSILRQRLASLVYINVEGEVTRSGSVVSFNSPWLITDSPKWSTVLRNSGTTHYRSRYSVSVANLFGQKTVEDSYGEALILPGSLRLIEDDFNLPKWPGIYKLNYHIGLGDNPAFSQTKIIIYLPIYFLVVILFSLSVVLFVKIKNIKQKRV